MDIYEATNLMARRSLAMMLMEEYKIEVRWVTVLANWEILRFRAGGTWHNSYLRTNDLLELVEQLAADKNLTLELPGLEGVEK